MDKYVAGEWKIICMVCGLQKRNTDVTTDWRGWIVCKDTCLDKRNPQEFVRAKPERIVVPYSNPDDTEGQVTRTNVANAVTEVLSASLTNTIFAFTTTGAGSSRTVQLPSPSDSSFNGVSVNYTMFLLDDTTSDSTANITVTTAAGVIVGSTTLLLDNMAVFRNVPSANQWIRQ